MVCSFFVVPGAAKRQSKTREQPRSRPKTREQPRSSPKTREQPRSSPKKGAALQWPASMGPP